MDTNEKIVAQLAIPLLASLKEQGLVDKIDFVTRQRRDRMIVDYYRGAFFTATVLSKEPLAREIKEHVTKHLSGPHAFKHVCLLASMVL